MSKNIREDVNRKHSVNPLFGSGEQRPLHTRIVFRYRGRMNAVLCEAVNASGAVSHASVPFAAVYVTLTKQEHIRLVMEANSWKSLHHRATQRAQWVDRRHQYEMHGRDVAQVRYVLDDQRLVGQQRRRQDRQRGVFGAGDRYSSCQGYAAFDD